MTVRLQLLGAYTPIPKSITNYTGVARVTDIVYLALGETVSSLEIVFMHTDRKVYVQDVTVAAEAKARLFMSLDSGEANDVVPCATRLYFRNSDWGNVAEGVPLYADKGTAGNWTVTYPPASADNIRPVGSQREEQAIEFIGDLPWLGVVP